MVSFNNLVMSAVKRLAEAAATTTWLRCALVALSALGIVANASLNGQPIDFNQLNQLVAFGVATGILAVSSHFSYKAIKWA